MARYTGPVCRLCRRSGEKLMLKGDRCFTPKCAVDRRNRPPGAQKTSRFRRLSDRGLQLREKQKTRYVYGMLERQFRRFFDTSVKQAGITADNLLVMLERRLDNVVLRLGFADSLSQARQLVGHGHLLLNGHKTDVPSITVKEGDVISWREGSTKTEYYKTLAKTIESKTVAPWLKLDKQNLSGQVISLPTPEDVGTKFVGKNIVEYYSR
ncbi:MAG: 30S ribosomal protein S4 [Chloroflexota bacterium]